MKNKHLQAAVLLFGPLPELTMDDALKDFMVAFELKPEWIENLVYIARCYLDKKDQVGVELNKWGESEVANFTPSIIINWVRVNSSP